MGAAGVRLGAVILAAALSFPAAAGAQESASARLAAAPSATLSNGALRATVLLPDATRGFYRGTRFDWSGVVADVTYRKQSFYGPWFDRISGEVRDFSFDGDAIVAGPNTAMTGPAEEFDFDTPPGFADAPAGGMFVKIGVGALRRPDNAKYSPFRTYEVVDAGQRTVKVSKTRVEFTHRLQAAGYAYDYAKTISLAKGAPRLVIEHRLRNTGDKPITTTVYNHNFLTFGHVGVGAGWTLSAPFAITSSHPAPAELAQVGDGQIRYARKLTDKERVAMPMEGFGATPADAGATVRYAPSGASVSFKGDRPLSKMQLWSIRAVAAVEPFVTLTLAPGEEARWSWTYDYAAR